VGQIIDDPVVAVVELIANCYDAGADKVTVIWPDLPGEILSITDNGTGMTRQEFEKRWKTLAYDRVSEQGAQVVFPLGVGKAKRTAFGHNGKGRFSPLCFSDEYQVETWKDGSCTTATIQLARGGQIPFLLRIEKEKPKLGHGTCISAVARRYVLPSDSIRELIGFKFAVDPSFVIKVNGEAVKLLSLSRLTSDSDRARQHDMHTSGQWTLPRVLRRLSSRRRMSGKSHQSPSS
jgi:Histidine kinase-, DNA gyrase B-, and HSP90-like ATPase